MPIIRLSTTPNSGHRLKLNLRGVIVVDRGIFRHFVTLFVSRRRPISMRRGYVERCKWWGRLLTLPNVAVLSYVALCASIVGTNIDSYMISDGFLSQEEIKNFPEFIMKKTQQGFTLIELMIVIAIIGILAAVALPAYQDYVSRSQTAEAMNLAGGLKIQVADSFSDKGDFDDANSGQDGIPAAASVTGKYTDSVTVTGGSIAALIGGDASATIAGKTITLAPVTSSGSLSWTCSFDGEAKYMPSSCR